MKIEKKYLVIEEGSRGEMEGYEVVKSELGFEEFLEYLMEREVSKLDEEERESGYVEEFFSWELFEDFGEVCLGEERGYIVYELK